MDQKIEAQKLSVASIPGVASPNRGEATYCPICGRDGDPGLRRFGHLFCSEAHVEQYAVAQRPQAEVAPAPASEALADPEPAEGHGMACGIGTKGGLRKMGWCLAGGVGLLIALPLIASGGLAATAGSLLSVAALLACPVGMYLMMRAMMKAQHGEHRNDKGKEK
jgi:hypothetical protein